ncbi:LPXTG cell wall anchor domain-containing protein [Levilactobacillus spicheri]
MKWQYVMIGLMSGLLGGGPAVVSQAATATQETWTVYYQVENPTAKEAAQKHVQLGPYTETVPQGTRPQASDLGWEATHQADWDEVAKTVTWKYVTNNPVSINYRFTFEDKTTTEILAPKDVQLGTLAQIAQPRGYRFKNPQDAKHLATRLKNYWVIPVISENAPVTPPQPSEPSQPVVTPQHPAPQPPVTVPQQPSTPPATPHPALPGISGGGVATPSTPPATAQPTPPGPASSAAAKPGKPQPFPALTHPIWSATAPNTSGVTHHVSLERPLLTTPIKSSLADHPTKSAGAHKRPVTLPVAYAHEPVASAQSAARPTRSAHPTKKTGSSAKPHPRSTEHDATFWDSPSLLTAGDAATKETTSAKRLPQTGEARQHLGWWGSWGLLMGLVGWSFRRFRRE